MDWGFKSSSDQEKRSRTIHTCIQVIAQPNNMRTIKTHNQAINQASKHTIIQASNQSILIAILLVIDLAHMILNQCKL